MIIEIASCSGARALVWARPLRRQRRLRRDGAGSPHTTRVESPGVARVLSTAVVLALLAATAVAFVITEGAKLEQSPITGRRSTPVFSPASKVPTKQIAHVRFRLRTAERLESGSRTANGETGRDAARAAPSRAGRSSTSSGTASPTAASSCPTGLHAGREAPALAPDDRPAEPDPARHEAAGDHGAAPAVPDPLARRRRPPGLVPRALRDQRARARDPLVRGPQVVLHAQPEDAGSSNWNGKLGEPAKPYARAATS